MTNIKKFKKLALTAALAAPAAFAATGAAQAAPAQPFAISVGGSFLTDSTAKHITSSSGLHVGLDWALPQKKDADTTGIPSIDVDYDVNSGHGAHINTVGVFLADRYTMSQSKKTGAVPYIGAGIGFASLSGARNITTTSPPPSSISTTRHVSKNATNFAGKIMAGVNFGQTFVEASYQINGDLDHVNADTIDLSIGTHF